MNVYDFDKTIYDGDSTADFYIFSLKRHKGIILLSPSLFGAFLRFYVFKRGTKTEFKEKMYRFLTKCELETDLADFWETHKKNIKRFYISQRRDDDLIISASPEFLLEPICRELGVALLASRVDGKSGKYDGINCHGKEKVRRFCEAYPDGVIDDFYSDSHSDDPLAEISKRAFLVKGERLTAWK